MIDKQRILIVADSVKEWAMLRNLIKGATAKDQTLKLVSEFGETAYGVFGQDDAETIDGIGDSIVVSVVVCAQMGLDFEAVLDSAICLYSGDEIGGTTHSNLIYCMGQLGHMADQALKGQHEAFGRTLAVFLRHLDIICDIQGYNINECFESAYAVIKDRKGVMFNGAFIKEADPAYAGAIAAIAAENQGA